MSELLVFMLFISPYICGIIAERKAIEISKEKEGFLNMIPVFQKRMLVYLTMLLVSVITTIFLLNLLLTLQ